MPSLKEIDKALGLSQIVPAAWRMLLERMRQEPHQSLKNPKTSALEFWKAL